MGAEGSARLWGAAQPPPTDGLLDRPLSRRQLLRGAGLGGVALIGPGLMHLVLQAAQLFLCLLKLVYCGGRFGRARR